MTQHTHVYSRNESICKYFAGMLGIWHSIKALGKLWAWVKGSADLMSPEQREWLSRRVISADCFDLKCVNHFWMIPKPSVLLFNLSGFGYHLHGLSKLRSSTNLCCSEGNHYACITQRLRVIHYSHCFLYIINLTNVPYISIWPPSCSYYALESF